MGINQRIGSAKDARAIHRELRLSRSTIQKAKVLQGPPAEKQEMVKSLMQRQEISTQIMQQQELGKILEIATADGTNSLAQRLV
jgi:hypothetical protein